MCESEWVCVCGLGSSFSKNICESVFKDEMKRLVLIIDKLLEHSTILFYILFRFNFFPIQNFSSDLN